MEQKKRVPKRRFKGFVDEWSQQKVGEIGNFYYGGGTPKTGKDEYWGGDLPWIQSSDISENILYVNEPKKTITEAGLKNSATKLVPANSIAIVTRVGVGKLALIPYDYSTSQDFLSISDLNVDSWFGTYVMYKLLQKERKAVQGTSIKGVTKDDLLSMRVMIPNELEEQKMIGLFLKKLDETITLQQRKLEKTKEIKSAYLAEMFPAEGERVPKRRFAGFTGEWEERKFGDLGCFGKTYSYSRANEGVGDYYHIHYGDIHARFDGLIKKTTKIPSLKVEGNYETLNNGDIVIADASEDYKDLGKTVVIEETDKRKIIAGLHTFKFTPNKYMNSLFYLYYSQSNLFKKFSYKTGTGISVFGISKENINKMKLDVPSYIEQQKIGEFFKKLDDLIASHQRKLEKLQALKQAYLHEMFV
ncbi:MULTISPECIES: restriction endonuclease subunit S [Clostridia]|uniref:restriction endonuclease subunit S n=1 Tax=Clostridia TaxID=186801 RepID=UPI000EA1C2E8|nr:MULTISPECIES: restriction endonuclease subunit S [Clostridia]NBJ68930.1 restriction endonuclease subunit S [Roseburia sp. 1XD42-34]RKI79835.1 restriction endonuclease subunit S [Clostridium sp. 1xD42-85]